MKTNNSTTTRKGKIARLPLRIRASVNARLDDGEPGTKIVEWLNSLPEVQAVLEMEFQGRPIREQNLTEWRRGGYREWQENAPVINAAMRLRERMKGTGADDTAAVTEALTHWVVARYAVATNRVLEAEGPEEWRLLRELCADVMQLRKSAQNEEWISLERKRIMMAMDEGSFKRKRKIIIGLEAVKHLAENNPRAREALAVLADLARDRKNPDEKPGGPLAPNLDPEKSD
jgi:hypothetical protein